MAHIVCTAEKVYESAKAVIKGIEEERIARDEKPITHVMGHKRVAWWKVWQPVGMTREQAIKWLDTSDMWGWRSDYAGGALNTAKKLLILAEHGDPVTIDEESAAVLWG